VVALGLKAATTGWRDEGAGVEDPTYRAAGHPWRAGRAWELAGVLGRPVRGEEEKQGRGARRGRCQLGPGCQREKRERRCAWAGEELGRAWLTRKGEERGEGGDGKERVGRGLGRLGCSFFFCFSPFLFLSKLTQINLNPNEI
jgi:hypothetical protein